MAEKLREPRNARGMSVRAIAAREDVTVMTFYETLVVAMGDRGMTPSEVCERANLHPSYISKLKSGHTKSVTWEYAIAIVRALGMTLNDFCAIQEANADEYKDAWRCDMTAREYMAFKLRELRKARGMTVQEVGSAVGKSDRTVSAWEVGRGQPDADMLVKLCILYEANISDFYPDDANSHESDEDELLMYFRKLDAGTKAAILSFVRDLSILKS